MSTGSGRKNGNGAARPIRNERDYMGAASAAKQLRRQANPDTTAELRLKALIDEMDKFEAMNSGVDDLDESDDDDDVYDGPRRRWSDEL